MVPREGSTCLRCITGTSCEAGNQPSTVPLHQVTCDDHSALPVPKSTEREFSFRQQEDDKFVMPGKPHWPQNPTYEATGSRR